MLTMCFFWGKTFSVGKYDGQIVSVSDMGITNILKALYALKIYFCRKKCQVFAKFFLADSEKTHSPSFMLDRWSVTEFEQLESRQQDW